jgi:DNA-binding Xre family transcriptional regulator
MTEKPGDPWPHAGVVPESKFPSPEAPESGPGTLSLAHPHARKHYFLTTAQSANFNRFLSVYLKGEMMGKVRRAASRGKSRGLGYVDEEVGARVRQFRLRRGLSQAMLADGLGVTFQQVQKYEKGTNAIATARLPMLCDVLGITPNDLYGDLFTNKRSNNPPAPHWTRSPSRPRS